MRRGGQVVIAAEDPASTCALAIIVGQGGTSAAALPLDRNPELLRFPDLSRFPGALGLPVWMFLLHGLREVANVIPDGYRNGVEPDLAAFRLPRKGPPLAAGSSRRLA